MNQPLKLILLLIGIFIAGAVAGGFGTLRFARHAVQRHASPEQWGPARLKKLGEHLSLTPEQEEKLRPIMRRDMDELVRMRTASFAEGKRLFDQMDHDIAEILTPEQREKFEQMNRERREHMQKIMKDRPFGEREGPPPGHERPGEHDEPAPPPAKPPGGI